MDTACLFSCRFFLLSKHLLLLVTCSCRNVLNGRVDPPCSVTQLTSRTCLPMWPPVSYIECSGNLRQGCIASSLFIGKHETRYRCICIHIGQYPRYVQTRHCHGLCKDMGWNMIIETEHTVIPSRKFKMFRIPANNFWITAARMPPSDVTAE